MTKPTPGSSAATSLLARLRRPLLWTSAVLACVAVAGFFVLPPMVRGYAQTALTEKLGRQVSIGEVRLNPFGLSAELRGVRVAEADRAGEALAIDRVEANVEAMSLVSGGLVLSELHVAGPRVHVVRLEPGRYNWSDVAERLAANKSDKPFLFSLNNIRIDGGEIDFDDRPRGLRQQVTELALGIPFVSNLPVKVNIFVEPALSARVNGNPVKVDGRTKPFSPDRETSLDLAVDGLDLTRYVEYLPFPPAFRLASGRLTTHLSLAFAQPREGAPTVGLKGTVELADLDIEDAAGAPAIRLPEAAVELTDVQPLARKWYFARLRLQAPEVDVVRLRDGGINLARLLPPQEKSADGKAAAPLDFLLESARLRDGRVRFTDQSLATPFTGSLEAVNADLRNLASTAGDPADLLVDFESDGGEKVKFQDRLRLVPFELEGRTTVENLRPARYRAYLRKVMPGGELRSGRVDGALRYRIAAAGGDDIDGEIVAESLALRDFILGLDGRKAPLATLAAMDVREATLHPRTRSVEVDEVGVRGAALALGREAGGALDTEKLFGPARDDKDKGAPWSMAVKRLRLEEGSVRFEDRSTGTPAVIAADKLTLNVAGLDTQRGKAVVAADVRFERGGRASLAGTLALAPLKADLKVDVDALDLRPLQPYLAKRENIGIAGGHLDTHGRLALARGQNGELTGGFRGELGVDDFASVDKRNATELARWRALHATGADVRLSPFAVSVSEIAVDGLSGRLILDESGRLNLRELAAKPPAEAAAPTRGEGSATAELAPAPAALPRVSVGRVVLRDGKIAFSDRFVRPNYDARLTGLEGQLANLSTAPESMARLDLRGRVDGSAPVVVSGQLAPFRRDRFLDIDANVRDFELSRMSGYAGKYVGYGIERGTLSAQVHYKIQDRVLSATNRVFVDQLTFGQPVESTQALNIPVRLGVALLKDPSGKIEFDLPVSGSLDDPQFSVSGLVFRAFANLIAKAAMSPFTALGALVGGDGEKLSYAEFVPGVTDIDEAMRQKLASLAKALNERPQLTLDITGRADRDDDPSGLRQVILERELRALKRRELVAKGEAAPPADALVVSAKDYPVLLRRLYLEGKFDKPRNFFGRPKEVPAEQMVSMIVANTPVTDAELAELARRRAGAVRDWLVAEGKVDPQRLNLLEPQVVAQDGRRTTFALH